LPAHWRGVLAVKKIFDLIKLTLLGGCLTNGLVIIAAEIRYFWICYGFPAALFPHAALRIFLYYPEGPVEKIWHAEVP
jgi:hypothetical protein